MCPYPEEHTGPESEPACGNKGSQQSHKYIQEFKTDNNKLPGSVKTLSMVGGVVGEEVTGTRCPLFHGHREKHNNF